MNDKNNATIKCDITICYDAMPMLARESTRLGDYPSGSAESPMSPSEVGDTT